ncbi:hypothetical protein OSTOST_25743, partial [Ostertagia ostertagi]
MSALVFALLLTACVNANSPLERRYEPVQELKMFKREAADEVEPKEDSIEEVNIKSGAAYNLFQGDILLTKEQKEKIALDVEETRAKRQAFNVNGTWPARKWTNGVTFILAGYLDERTKTAFKKAAKLWMEDTCINITEFQVPPPKGVRLREGFSLKKRCGV